MTFGILRIALGNKKKSNIWEMYRFCSNNGISITGGASKLFKYFIKNYSPESIISYADKRWSIGNLYIKMGFNKVSESFPNYFYVQNYYKRYHRFNFRKNVLVKKLKIFDPNLSEWENMKNNGWDRIWDCGTIKFEWISQYK